MAIAQNVCCALVKIVEEINSHSVVVGIQLEREVLGMTVCDKTIHQQTILRQNVQIFIYLYTIMFCKQLTEQNNGNR